MKTSVNNDTEPLHEAMVTSLGWNAELLSASSMFGARALGRPFHLWLVSFDAEQQGQAHHGSRAM